MKCLHHNLLKEVNVDNKYLSCLDIWDKKFEVFRSLIALNKVNLDFAETVKAKPTRNDLGFITYSNTINFQVNGLNQWLSNNSMENICKRTGYHMVQKIGKNQKIDQIWKN